MMVVIGIGIGIVIVVVVVVGIAGIVVAYRMGDYLLDFYPFLILAIPNL